MNANDLLDLLESKKQRRSEKVRHLGLDHQPVIYEIYAAEKNEIQKRLDATEDFEQKQDVVLEVVIRSMCGWDDSGEITEEHRERFLSVYSTEVILELYKCICDFGYLHEQGIVQAKKS